MRPSTPHPELEALIERVRDHKMTDDEVFEQRLSFVYGQLPAGSGLTREQVREQLARHYGSTRSFFSDVEAFHKRFDLKPNSIPGPLTAELQDFRDQFIDEELEEYQRGVSLMRLASRNGDAAALREGTIQAFDALVDLAYVVIGTAHLHGFNFDTAWKRVHAANMKKVRAQPDGVDSKRASGYDVVKPKGWEPPDYEDLVPKELASQGSVLPKP